MIKYTVYKTTNNINGRYYIGVHKTKNPNDSYLGSGKLLRFAIKKYGIENFTKEILYSFDDIKDAYKKEKEIVNQEFLKLEETYNVAVGGSISPDYDDQRKLLYSKRISGINHHFFGKHHSPESNKARSDKLRGRKMLPEQIEKSAKSRRGQISPMKGKTLSSESREKISIAKRNYKKTKCPNCHVICDPQNLKRWHGDRCKSLLQTVDDVI